MPPLMLTPDEIEAAVLGAQWVAGRGDPVLAGAARDLIAKVTTAVPERLRPFIAEPAIGTRPGWATAPDDIDIAQTRAWIHSGRKIRITYRDEHGETSQRTLWPVIVGYFETVRMLAAWCELRRDFRSFRTDRITAADFLDERHGCRAGELRSRWRQYMARKHSTEGLV